MAPKTETVNMRPLSIFSGILWLKTITQTIYKLNIPILSTPLYPNNSFWHAYLIYFWCFPAVSCKKVTLRDETKGIWLSIGRNENQKKKNPNSEVIFFFYIWG